MPHPKKLKRVMEYFIIYHPETNSYFCNKSKNPRVSARQQFHRAFSLDRKDYECDFYKDIRNYGPDAFIIRYSIEMPEFCVCRAHYVKNNEKNDEVYEKVKAMRTQPTPPENAPLHYLKNQQKLYGEEMNEHNPS